MCLSNVTIWAPSSSSRSFSRNKRHFRESVCQSNLIYWVRLGVLPLIQFSLQLTGLIHLAETTTSSSNLLRNRWMHFGQICLSTGPHSSNKRKRARLDRLAAIAVHLSCFTCLSVCRSDSDSGAGNEGYNSIQLVSIETPRSWSCTRHRKWGLESTGISVSMKMEKGIGIGTGKENKMNCWHCWNEIVLVFSSRNHSIDCIATGSPVIV